MGPAVRVVDISGWSSGDQSARRRIAAELDEACRAIGFVHIVGHDVPGSLCDRLKDVAEEFFGLAEAEKRRYEPASRDVNRGYSARRSESLAYTLGEARPPDLAEAFIVGAQRYVAGDPYFEAERARSFAPNPWPDRPSAFREVVSEYFERVGALSRALLDMASLALGVDPSVFRDATSRSVETLRCNWYQRGADELLDPAQMGLGAHTDYGIVTVLLADPAPGLEVMGTDGVWQPVLPLDGGFVVNVGDALAMWTNDMWTSTIHRVQPGVAGSPPRRSFAFFQDGDLDAVITCLPTCRSTQNPQRYAPVTLGAHLLDKIRGGRALELPEVAVQTTAGRVPTEG